MLDREWTIQVNSHHTNLLALSHQMVDSLAGSLCGRTHEDDDALGIGSSVIVKEVIFATCDLGNLGQIVLHYGWNSIVGSVAGLAVCEKCLGVFSGTAGLWTLRGEGTVAETFHIGRVNELGHVFLLHHFNLVILVGSTETVKEVDERHTSLQCCKVRHGGEVHHLLH